MVNFKEFKKFFIFAFIGSLIVSALVAVIAVLIGQFNEITGRVFLTLFMVILHSLVALAFIWDDSRRNTFTKLAFFVNTIFILVVLSFVTSLFGVWKIVNADTIWHLYQTYFLVAFASLHADMLSKVLGKEKYMDYTIFGNYAFITLVVLMFLPIIFIKDAYQTLGGFYFRSLAAAGIIDGTLSILTIIFYKLYMHKHPEIVQVEQTSKKGLSIWLWILIIYLIFQFGFPLFSLLGGFWQNK